MRNVCGSDNTCNVRFSCEVNANSKSLAEVATLVSNEPKTRPSRGYVECICLSMKRKVIGRVIGRKEDKKIEKALY